MGKNEEKIKAIFKDVQSVLVSDCEDDGFKRVEAESLYWCNYTVFDAVYVGSFVKYLNGAENDKSIYEYDADYDPYDVRRKIYNLFLECVRKYDRDSGEFENYFNRSWKLRKYDYAKEYKEWYHSLGLNQPTEESSDSDEKLTYESVIPSSNISVEKTAVNRVFIGRLYLDVGSNISNLLSMKSNDKKARHFKCFYSEDVIKAVKNVEKIDNSKRIYSSTCQDFIDYCMIKVCNCLEDVQVTPLKKRSDFGILQSPEEELPWEIVKKRNKDGMIEFSMKRFPAKVYFDYFGETNKKSFNSTISTERKEYEELYRNILIER